MKFFYLLFSILIIQVSCKESSEVQFKKNGYSFTCPEGWSISKEIGNHKAGAIKIVKDGYIYTPYILINDWNKNIDIDTLIKFYRTEIGNNIIFKLTNVEVGKVYDAQYGEKPAKSFDFTTSVGNTQIHGKIFIFYSGDKTFAVSEYKYHRNDVLGFKKIEQTLKTE